LAVGERLPPQDLGEQLIGEKRKEGFDAASKEWRPTAQGGRQARYQVICVVAGSGFPLGAMDAPRIINVGKALQKAGIKFRVLHCGPSPISANMNSVGVHEEIAYEYTTYTTKRPKNVLLRTLLYAWGILILIARLVALRPQRRRTSVYIYIHKGPIGVLSAAVCRILGIPVVQEVNEWWPGTGTHDDSRFTNWLYKGPMFSLATGTLVISTLIEERVRAVSQGLKRPLIVQRTPILVDINKFYPGGPASAFLNGLVPQFVWCGAVAVYLKDMDFLIRALARVIQKNMKCQLTIVGSACEDARRRVRQYAEAQGVADAVLMTGFVDDYQLNSIYRSAAGLLLPLFDDDRSRTRMPTKLGGYLASGTPVITCDVGDLTGLLSHKLNAYLGAPNDEVAFAENMCSVLRDPETARKIGAAGRSLCEAEIHYEVHSTRLANFFAACIESEL
jgi:glycosyltransferase involved in cell wall biosynthesis